MDLQLTVAYDATWITVGQRFLAEMLAAGRVRINVTSVNKMCTYVFARTFNCIILGKLVQLLYLNVNL